MAERHPDYWEIKSAYQQFKLNEQANQRQLAAVLIPKGLDPDATYLLQDADQSITQQDPPSASWSFARDRSPSVTDQTDRH